MEPKIGGLDDDFPDINWVIIRFHVGLPPFPVNGDHQDYFMFSRGFL